MMVSLSPHTEEHEFYACKFCQDVVHKPSTSLQEDKWSEQVVCDDPSSIQGQKQEADLFVLKGKEGSCESHQ